MNNIKTNIKNIVKQRKSPLKATNKPTDSLRIKTALIANECVSYEEVANSAKFLQSKVKSVKPVIGIICGSGLGELGNLLSEQQVFEYNDIPDFPVSTVVGHQGALVFGFLGKVPVVCMKGRIHSYEGYSLARCTFPIRVMKMLGIHTLIVTNAAGGLNDEYNVGDIMLIKDQIFFPALAGNNPLRGPNDERFGPRFPPMSEGYDKKLMELAEKSAKKLSLTQYFRKGVYGMVGGPNFETIAEARFLKIVGVDAVGMSTAHEVLVARHAGLRVLGFSLITNLVNTEYESNVKVNHEEVLVIAKGRSKDFESLIREIVANIESAN